MKTRILLLVFCLFLIAAIPRFLSLEAHWSSDETRWLRRSAQFMSAVKHESFPKLLLPTTRGVTTMWLGGLRTFFTEPPQVNALALKMGSTQSVPIMVRCKDGLLWKSVAVKTATLALESLLGIHFSLNYSAVMGKLSMGKISKYGA